MEDNKENKSSLVKDIVGMLKSRHKLKKINKKFVKQQKGRLKPYNTLMGYNRDKANSQIDLHMKGNNAKKVREYVDSQIKKIK